MIQAFQNPNLTRALAHDMETGEDAARFQDRWAYVASDGRTYSHPTQRGAEKLAHRAQVADDTGYSSRRSIHFFDNEEEAIRYRDDHGTGGWIFVCDDKGEATIFPYQMTPRDILNTGRTSISGGRFIGSTGKIIRQEDVA